MIGIDKKETVKFSASNDQGENRTVFVLGSMTQRDRIAIFGQAVGKDGKVNAEAIQEKAYDIFLKGVKRIENLMPGVPETSDLTDEVMDSIPFPALMEVVAKIMEINFADGAARKN